MTIHRKGDHDDPSVRPVQVASDAAGLSGRLETGYGHRAYQPDPNAHYGFDPGPPRTLPKDKKQRWRVPG